MVTIAIKYKYAIARRKTVQDGSSAGETRYRARFYLDPNGLSMNNGHLLTLFQAWRSGSPDRNVVGLFIRYNNGYQMRLFYRTDSNQLVNSPEFAIQDGVHALEIEWQAASSSGANNGILQLWLDEATTPQYSLTTVDNDTHQINFVRLGVVEAPAKSTNGAHCLDHFESRRTGFIGGASFLYGCYPDSFTGEETAALEQRLPPPAPPHGHANPHPAARRRPPAPLPPFSPAPALLFSAPLTPTTVITYTYDPLSRLAAAEYDNGISYLYDYDAVGNRTERRECLTGQGCNTTTYTYDDANRLNTVNGGDPYVWDDNGNLLDDGTNMYTYDFANRLVSVDSGQSAVSSYQYNGLGDRLSQTVDAVTTNYTLDLARGLTQVLDDGMHTYLYGNMRIAQVPTSSPNSYAYFLTDALGSVRQLVNETGELTLAQAYQPYGETLSSMGSGATSYGFTGESRDATGLIFLRARYYAPGAGRFTTKDLWTGDMYRPMSFNKWLYGYANPVNFSDPSGYAPCSSAQAERLCILNNGGYLDKKHFEASFGIAERIYRYLSKAEGDFDYSFPLGGSLSGQVPIPFAKRYFTRIPMGGLHADENTGVALGIFLDYQIGFEKAQGYIPNCWINFPVLFYIPALHCSAFSNEDMPSNYLGFVSYAKGPALPFENIVGILGGGTVSTDIPEGYYGNFWEPAVCRFGICPGPYNDRCELKIFDPESGKYLNQPWPSVLSLMPSGFGVYWGTSASDFVSPIPTPPPPPTGTPTP